MVGRDRPGTGDVVIAFRDPNGNAEIELLEKSDRILAVITSQFFVSAKPLDEISNLNYGRTPPHRNRFLYTLHQRRKISFGNPRITFNLANAFRMLAFHQVKIMMIKMIEMDVADQRKTPLGISGRRRGRLSKNNTAVSGTNQISTPNSRGSPL